MGNSVQRMLGTVPDIYSAPSGNDPRSGSVALQVMAEHKV